MLRRGALATTLRAWSAGARRASTSSSSSSSSGGDGSCWVAAWGNGDWGRLGDGACKNKTQPHRVLGLPAGVAPLAVAAGGAHTVVLLTDGRVLSCGLNDYAQLGHSAGEECSPTLRCVAGLPPDVIAVAAGHFHTLAVTRGGELWAWGRNKERQLGLGDGAPSVVAAPTRVAVPEAVAAVAVGARHSLAVTPSGALYSWGARALLGLGAAERWRLRLATYESEPRLVRALRGVRVRVAAAGGAHSAVADTDGRVYTFGEGAFCQLGTGDSRPALEPVQVQGVHAVSALACGGLHTIVATDDGTVWVWGANEHGCLGLGDDGAVQLRTPSRLAGVALTRVSAGWKHTAGLTAAGALHAWGWGGSMGEGEDSSGGQLGLDNDFDYWTPAAVPLPSGVRVLQLSAGWNHTAGLFCGT
jgi:alpha-tubulin suppressor-like RCC1 family protein